MSRWVVGGGCGDGKARLAMEDGGWRMGDG